MKIQLIHNRPILDIENDMALNRDRIPDRDWSGLIRSSTKFNKVTTVELTPKYKQILLEDLAYAYGHDTEKFRKKLKEFNLL